MSRTDQRAVISDQRMRILDQRMLILRRLRRYLEEQRDRFLSYLRLLDQENAAIQGGDIDRIRYHVELEQGIIRDIVTLQRAIDPLWELYRLGSAGRQEQPGAQKPGESRDAVACLESSLRSLREKAQIRNAENRRLLRDRLDGLRLEIKELGTRRKPHLSPFARIGEPKLVDLRS